MATHPSMPTPEEIRYQFHHKDDNREPQIIAVHVLVYTLAVATVALRFYARRMARVRYGWDDWLILIGLVSCIIFPIEAGKHP